MKSRFTVFFAFLLLASTSYAQDADDEPLARQFTKGQAIRKRGSIKSLRNHRVSIGGRKTVTIGQITDKVFADHRALAGEINRGRRGLVAAPSDSDEVIETDDAVVITTSTSFTVSDPDTLRRQSRRFASFRSKKQRAGWKLSQLDAKARKEFDAFRARAKKLRAGHPLRVAADAGDDALVDALLDGKGDFTVEETIIIPTKAMKRSASGKLLVPKRTSSGDFDYRSGNEARSSIGRQMRGNGGDREEDVSRPKTRTKRQSTSTSKFLTGFTKEDNFIWQKKWKFPSGHFSIKFKAWYEFGLRVPLEVKGTLSPATIVHTGPADKDVPFEVTLSAKTVDADAAFYKETGIDSDLVRKGKEFLLGSGFEVVIDVKAGFVVKKKWTLPKNAEFDFSQDFKPPFGTCGSKCGIDLWIPSSVTRTEIGLLGIVKGSARLGFRLAGDGDVSVDFEALGGDSTVKSWLPGRKNDAREKHTVTFDKASTQRKLSAQAAAIPRKNVTKKFGYRLSKPIYRWDISLIPGVRADLRVKAKPFVNDNFPIGPLWLNSLAIDLGTVKLDRHKGTKNVYKLKHGDKTWAQ